MRTLHTTLLALILSGFSSSAWGLVFDWDAAYGSWTAGAPGVGGSATQNYNNDPNKPGHDVSITIANTNLAGSGFSWIDGYPSVDNSSTTGGLNPRQDALQFQLNDNNATGILVTITFNYTAGVRDVSFNLWD